MLMTRNSKIVCYYQAQAPNIFKKYIRILLGNKLKTIPAVSPSESMNKLGAPSTTDLFFLMRALVVSKTAIYGLYFARMLVG